MERISAMKIMMSDRRGRSREAWREGGGEERIWKKRRRWRQGGTAEDEGVRRRKSKTTAGEQVRDGKKNAREEKVQLS